MPALEQSRTQFVRPRFGLKEAAAVLGVTALLAGCGGSSRHVSAPRKSKSPPAAPTFHPLSKKTFTETTDNHLGTPVFSSAEGGAPPNDVPQRIPFDTKVAVGCYAPNESGMSSVNDFYLIVSGRWRHLYAPADTFTNGGPLGPNSDNLDAHVPKCAS